MSARILALAVVFSAAPTWAQAPPPLPLTEQRYQFLLLDTHQIIEGAITRNGDGDYVHGKTVYPAKRVLVADDSRARVRDHLDRLAQERVVAPVAGEQPGYNRLAQRAFAARIQPILANQCASCHANPEHAGAFKLKHGAAGFLDSGEAGENLPAALAQLARADPLRSPLLGYARAAHGPQKSPCFDNPSHPAFAALEVWAAWACAPDGSPMPAQLDRRPRTPLSEPSAFAAPPATVPTGPVAAASGESVAANPHDPGPFNRHFFARRTATPPAPAGGTPKASASAPAPTPPGSRGTP